jgi:hypothetical protein
MVADHGVGPNQDVVAGLEPVAGSHVAVDYRAGADAGVSPDTSRAATLSVSEPELGAGLNLAVVTGSEELFEQPSLSSPAGSCLQFPG